MVGKLLLLSLMIAACSSSNSSRVVPSSQSRSFWDQITANNEQGKSPSSSDDSIFGPAEISRQDGNQQRPTAETSSGSLRDVLESRKARRNMECRPDFCYQMQASSASAASASSSYGTRVCGTDGKTYNSRCMLQFLRRCHGQKVRVRHRGACGAPLHREEAAGAAAGTSGATASNRRLSRRRGRCQDMRLAALEKSSSGRQVIYVPQCSRKGRFRRVQCNYQLKYCFCVRRRSGKPLPGSGVQLPRRPSCRGRKRRRKKKSKQQRQQRRRERQKQRQRNAQRGRNNRKNSRRKGRRRKGGRRGSGRKNRCSSRQRAQFNRNILKQFEIEYNASITFRAGGVLKPRREINRLPIRGEVVQNSQQQSDINVRSAEWKFTELDVSRNGQLNYRETKALRKVTRANIKPKGCARRFFRTCDLNANKQLERAEWILCFGLENSTPVTVVSSPSAAAGAMPRSSGGVAAPLVAVATATPAVSSGGVSSVAESYAVSRGRPVAVSGSSSSKGSLMELVSRRRKRKRPRKARPFARKSCPLAREEALQKNRQLSQLRTASGRASARQTGRVFVPECSPDGKYAKRQCHTSGASETTTSLCFCMDPDSGRVLKGGTGSGVTLDCESAHIRARAAASAGFRGCSQPLLRQFAVQLTALMVQETRDAWRPEDGHLSVEARSLKLRFQRADVNRDGQLDRKERRWWRREIKAYWKSSDPAAAAAIPERRRTRKCAANFLRFCNANGDQFVTLAELQACLGLPNT